MGAARRRWHACPMSRATSPSSGFAASPVIYVASDVPEGMSLHEWRIRRHPATTSPVVRIVRRACGLG
jgi:hypothetical protein